jgi:hypothetical protein
MTRVLFFLLLLSAAARADVRYCNLQIGPSGPIPTTGAERHFCDVQTGRIRRICDRLCKRYPQSATCTRVCSGFPNYYISARCAPSIPTIQECCDAGFPVEIDGRNLCP